MTDFRDVWFKSHDQLALFARDYGDRRAPPVICLSGLTRNSREFHALAQDLSTDHRVIAADYRGRGRSAHASDWQTYDVANELQDVMTLMTHLGIERAAFIGTSRGGIIAMVLASLARDRVAAIVLNDVGPVIESAGLARICANIAAQREPRDWSDAVGMVKAAYPGFVLDEREWIDFARVIYRDIDGRPARDFDPALGNTLPDAKSLSKSALPDLWPQFEGIAGLPCAVIRGANSDLLADRTVAEMRARVPDLVSVTVDGRGHTPFLTEPDALGAVRRTLNSCFSQ